MNFSTPKIFQGILDNWKHDWANDRRLFWLESIGTLGCVVAAATLAITAANPNMLMVYCAYFVGSSHLVASSYIRNNGWWVLLNLVFMLFDSIGIYNVLTK